MDAVSHHLDHTDQEAKPREVRRTHRRAMYAELTKARLSMLVVITAGVGYILGAPEGVNFVDLLWQMWARVAAGEAREAMALATAAIGAFDWLEFFIVIAAVGLAAGGTSALNQWLEVDRDAAMVRTAQRPLPARRMSRNEAFLAGIAMVVTGGGVLFFAVNALAGVLTLLTALIYIFIYTPLKAKSTLNTLVGAVCGAIPPMIGWAAAADSLALGAWALAGVLFIWQLPHFLALAWLHREDYERGGFRMLPIIDRGGELTCQVALVTALLLIPLSLMLVLALRQPNGAFGGGLLYASCALILGGYMVVKAVGLYRQRSDRAARGLFIASIIYLPLLLIVLVIDQPRPPIGAPKSNQILAAADSND